MIINTTTANIFAEVLRQNKESSKYLFLLHGFTGSSKDWEDVYHLIDERFNIVAFDLVGHGKSESPYKVESYSADAISNQIIESIRHFNIDENFLLGYSMGGRAALNTAINEPSLLKGLILESTSPGFKNIKAKEERIEQDEELAKYIESHTTEEFADYWLNIDLFNTLRRFSEEKRQELKKSRIQNNRVGLANMLRGFGTGSMPNLANNLKKISAKSLIITGDLDPKFTNLGKIMNKKISDSNHIIIKNSGHNTHLEETGSFIEELNGFLKKF